MSLYRLIFPLAIAGLLLGAGMFLLDDTFLPYANQRQDALRNEIKGRPAQTYFQPARQWIFGQNRTKSTITSFSIPTGNFLAA